MTYGNLKSEVDNNPVLPISKTITNNISSSGDDFMQITQTLNHSQIVNLETSNIIVVPRPGAGKYNMFIQALISPNLQVAYGNITDSAYIVIGYEDDLEISSLILDDAGNSATGLTKLLIDSAGLNGSNTRMVIPNQRDISGWGLVSQYGSGDVLSREDKALQIILQNNLAGPLSDGDSANELTVTVIYVTVNL